MINNKTNYFQNMLEICTQNITLRNHSLHVELMALGNDIPTNQLFETRIVKSPPQLLGLGFFLSLCVV